MKRCGIKYAKVNLYSDITEKECLEQSIKDNTIREDLNQMEMAVQCVKLKESGYKIPELCKLFNLKKTVVYDLLTLGRLDVTTKYCLKKKAITLNHAVELARLNTDKTKPWTEQRLKILEYVLLYNWSVSFLKQFIGPTKRSFIACGYGILCPKTLKQVELEYKKGIFIGTKNAKNDSGHIYEYIEECCEKCQYYKGIKTIQNKEINPDDARYIYIKADNNVFRNRLFLHNTERIRTDNKL